MRVSIKTHDNNNTQVGDENSVKSSPCIIQEKANFITIRKIKDACDNLYVNL